MAELTEQQIELISTYIKQNGVAQDTLHDDLLDHVCTSVEHLLDEGLSFDDAFAKTIKLFGPGGLKQVQQQTFELLTEMNETMKKVAFSFGLTSAILLLAGTIFKLMHWPGAGIMIVLGGAMLTLGYLPMLLVHKLKESVPGDRFMLVSGYLGMTMTAIGVLFKFMHWPGALASLISGLALLGFVYIPIFFVKRYKSAANKALTLSTSLVAFTCLVLVFALISVSNSSDHERGSVMINLQLDQSSENLATANVVLYDRLRNDESAELIRSSAAEAFDYLEAAKLHLIAEAHEISVDQAKNITAINLRDKSNLGTPLHILWQPEPNQEHSMEQILGRLSAFRSNMLNTLLLESKQDIAPFVPFQWIDNGTNAMNWAKEHFYRVQLSVVLAQLTHLQLEIQNAESRALIYLISRSAASDPPSGS